MNNPFLPFGRSGFQLLFYRLSAATFARAPSVIEFETTAVTTLGETFANLRIRCVPN